MNRQLYPSSFHPLYISSPPLSFFIFPYRSGFVSPRATETPRSCLEESAPFLHTEPCSRYRFDRVTTVPAPSYKSRGHEPPCSTVNFGPRDRRPPSPIVSINEIYVTDARDPKDPSRSLNGFREGMLFVERESRKCAKLFIINSTKFLNVKAQEIARNDIYDNRKEGWKGGGGNLSRCTRSDFYEDYYGWEEGGWKHSPLGERYSRRRGIWIPAMLYQVCTDDFLMGASKVDPGLKS